MSLSESRRSIRKIQPARADYFDEQFWPVSVALCMTAAIAVGAVLSLLNGPWMWASLIALPVTLIVTLAALQRLHDGLVRRSLQFAVVVSAAIHLLILLMFGLTEIFGSYNRPEKPVETQSRAERVLLISQRDPDPIWRQINRRETAEPVVETEREPTKTDPTPPQPIEVEQTRPTESPQANRRSEPNRSVPRYAESRSQLRRSTGAESLQSKTPEPSLSTESARPRKSSSPEASSTSSRETASREAVTPDVQSAPASDLATPEVQTSRRESSHANEPASAESQASARTRNSQTQIPQTAIEQSSVVEAATRERDPSPAARERTAETARSRRTDSELNPTRTPLPETRRSERTESAIVNRRDAPQSMPSISQEDSPRAEPRRSNNASERVASLIPIEAPSATNSTTSNTAQPQAQSASTSVTRSEGQSALAQNARNLQQNDATASGVAANASDSAVRRRAESASQETPTLNAMQSATQRRSTASEQIPQSAWQANSQIAADRSGSRQPAVRSSESSAATAESAASAERSRMTAEAGSSQLDIGPTKLVADVAAERSGGGGAAALGPLNVEPQSTARTVSQSQSASLAASNNDPTQAIRATPSQSSQNGETQPNPTAIAETREGGASRTSGDVHVTPQTGAESDFATNDANDHLASASRRSSIDPTQSQLEGRIEPSDQRGNMRSGLSRAPNANVEVVLGGSGESSETGNSDRPEAANAEVSGGGEPNRASGIGSQASDFEIASRDDAANGVAARRAQSNRVASSEIDHEATGSTGRQAMMNSGVSADVDVEIEASGTARANSAKSAASTANVSSERMGQSTQLDVIADDGPAGLGPTPDNVLGINSRPALRNSENLQLNADSRFNRAETGAMPSTSTDAVLAKEAFDSRESMRGNAEPSTEAAIEMGLAFLARHQRSDGSWSLGAFDSNHPMARSQMNSDSAATGLALLAFQGAGYTHREFKYAMQMQRAIDWLVNHQAADGGLFVDSDPMSNQNCRMYSHAIAALALTEAYGMTQDPRLVEPCRKALNYIAATQDTRGGWRYYAEPGMRESDISVTGWMMMALQSGRLADLSVPEDIWEGISRLLDVARDPTNESRFRYNPFDNSTDSGRMYQGRTVTPTRSSIGLLMRLYLGWNRNDERLLDGADYLLKNLPDDRTMIERDTYYWYYATQVLRHVGGPRWETWNGRLHPLLVGAQVKGGEMMGSWNPYEPIPDRWGKEGGRLYVTAMNLLSLEVNYRLLPLYDKTTR